MIDRGRLAPIDGLRAAAVLAVIAGHAGFLPAGIGARGVDLFFVISGFCLSLPFLSKGSPVNALRFWKGRFWRIGPPYWAALMLFWLLSFTAFGTPTTSGPATNWEVFREAFFFSDLSPTYNAAFWTLAIEARWYVAFPFILALYLRSRVGFGLLMIALYLLYLTPYRVYDAGTLPCFMLGIVAADIYLRGSINSAWFGIAAAALLAVSISVDRGHDHGDPLWHLAMFAVLLTGVGKAAPILAWRPLVFIGIASYSIYLVHTPFMRWMGKLHVAPIFAVLIALALGIGFWWMVEVPAIALREAQMRRPAQTPDPARGS